MLESAPQDVVVREPLAWVGIAETVVGKMFGCERLRLDGIRRTIRRARAIGTLEPKKSAPLNLTSNGALAETEAGLQARPHPPMRFGKTASRLFGSVRSVSLGLVSISLLACNPDVRVLEQPVVRLQALGSLAQHEAAARLLEALT